MLQQNLAYKIIAALAAIFLWFYVMITLENPVVEVGIGGVQLEPRGAASGLSVELIPNEVMVAVTGPRRAVSRLSSDAVTAWVNLKDLGPGRRRVKPRAQAQGGWPVRVKTSTVVAILRETSRKTLPVEIELLGPPAGYTLGRLASTPPDIQVEGKEAAVSRVARVVAKVDLRRGEDFAGEVEPQAVDVEGRPVTVVDLRPLKVWVDAAVAKAISASVVPVVVRTSGTVGPGFRVFAAAATPAVVTVTGQNVDGIRYVETGVVPLNGATTSFKASVNLIKPRRGASVVPEKVEVAITVERR